MGSLLNPHWLMSSCAILRKSGKIIVQLNSNHLCAEDSGQNILTFSFNRTCRKI